MATLFVCTKCAAKTFNFVDTKALPCRKCGAKTKRAEAFVGHEVRETKDNGWMPQKIDQLQNQENLLKDREEFHKKDK